MASCTEPAWKTYGRASSKSLRQEREEQRAWEAFLDSVYEARQLLSTLEQIMDQTDPETVHPSIADAYEAIQNHAFNLDEISDNPAELLRNVLTAVCENFAPAEVNAAIKAVESVVDALSTYNDLA